MNAPTTITKMPRRSLLSAFVFGSLLAAPLQADLVLDNFAASGESVKAYDGNNTNSSPGGTSDALGDRSLIVVLQNPIQGTSFAEVTMNAPSTVRFKYFNDNVVQPGVYTSSAYAVHYGSASLNLLGYDSFELDMARATSEFDPAASLQVYLEFNGEKVKNLALPSTSVPYVWTQADFGGVDFSAINDVRISADFSPIGSAELLPEFDLDFTQFRAVPEPHTFALISLGLVGFGLSRRRGTR